MTENTIRTVKIQNIIKECVGVKTITFNNFNAKTPKPGQFAMIWVPGVDEIPMSISGYEDAGNWSITVKNVGECTNAIHTLKIGDYIGVRGPLGNWFKIPKENTKKIIIISGGIGTAPPKFLAHILDTKKIPFDMIEATKSFNDLIFLEDFNQFESDTSKIMFCTELDDFPKNHLTISKIRKPEFKGLAHDHFEKLLKNSIKNGNSDFIVYTCGPEKMIFEIYKICSKYYNEYNIEFYASLERIMRCGCGLCGLCTLDPLGLLVCKDGPVFSFEDLKKIGDFGKYRRDFTGKKITIN